MDQDIDAPLVDINAIGAREARFPWWIFVAGAALLMAALAALTFFVDRALPLATIKKEDLPTTSATPDPGAAAPRLEIASPADGQAEGSKTQPQAGPQVPPVPNAPPPAIPGKAPTTGIATSPCPVRPIYDKTTQRPITDANGIPVTVDCTGNYSVSGIYPARPPAIKPLMGAPAAGSPAGVSGPMPAPVLADPPQTAQADRYQGEIILSRQVPPKTESTVPGAPQSLLPPPPVGAAEVLRQLRAIQQGQAAPAVAASPPVNPILAGGNTNPSSAPQAPNTQGNPVAMLTSSRTDRAFAVKSIDENLVIPKGVQIDCGLTTRAVTEISGFASCLVSRDVYSANGRVLLIERMSTVDGEYVAQGQAGQRYIHILWTRVRKPGGTTIDIASPATDGLGGAGVPAFVDNRWVERIGAAYMLSFVKDVIAYKTATDAQTGQSAAGAAAYQNTTRTSESMAERVLSNTIGIKPVLYANQGDRVAIYVARDLDFTKVYEVRAHAR
jgi:type IV secretory pathway VirB10-like protein